jgi:MFS family permease
MLGLLTGAMVISFADRSVLAMLIEPIKMEIGLSDTAIGFLTGFAFSAFYATFGLLMARLADGGANRFVIIGSLVTWSIMSALCGAAQNFWQLLIVRFGVGAGEAGIVPAGQAILTNLFPTRQRSTAMAILMAGGPLGILVAFAVTTPIETHLGWRATFVVLGIPGILLAVVFLVSGQTWSQVKTRHLTVPSRAPWHAAIRLLLTRPIYRQALLTITALNLLTFGQTQWLPAYIERSFAIPRPRIGPLLAMTQGIGMLIGMVAGGPLYDILGAFDTRWRARLLYLMALIGVPIVIAVYSVDSAYLAASLAGLAAAIFATASGQLFATVQESVPPTQRATGAALVMMLSAFIGMGCGPVFIGWLSDILTGTFAAQSLRYALLITVALGGLWLLIQVALLTRELAATRSISQDKIVSEEIR